VAGRRSSRRDRSAAGGLPADSVPTTALVAALPRRADIFRPAPPRPRLGPHVNYGGADSYGPISPMPPGAVEDAAVSTAPKPSRRFWPSYSEAGPRSRATFAHIVNNMIENREQAVRCPSHRHPARGHPRTSYRRSAGVAKRVTVPGCGDPREPAVGISRPAGGHVLT
jgi:hypothetical protein